MAAPIPTISLSTGKQGTFEYDAGMGGDTSAYVFYLSFLIFLCFSTSGSRQLSEDIERMRMILRAPVMHIYGISYGTQGTVSPNTVFLFRCEVTRSKPASFFISAIISVWDLCYPLPK